MDGLNMVKFFMGEGWTDSLIDETVKKIQETRGTESVVRGKDADGNEYIYVKRYNHLSMSNGTAVRADVDDDADAESLAEDMCYHVDHIV